MGSALVDNKQQLTPRSLPKGMSIAAPNPPNSSLYNLVLGHLHSDNECSIDVFITGLGMFLVSGYFLFSLSLSLSLSLYFSLFLLFLQPFRCAAHVLLQWKALDNRVQCLVFTTLSLRLVVSIELDEIIVATVYSLCFVRDLRSWAW